MKKERKKRISVTIEGDESAIDNYLATKMASPRRDNGKLKSGNIYLVGVNNSIDDNNDNLNINSQDEVQETIELSPATKQLIDVAIDFAAKYTVNVLIPKAKNFLFNCINNLFNAPKPVESSSKSIDTINYKELQHELLDEISDFNKNEFKYNISEDEARERMKRFLVCIILAAREREILRNSNIIFSDLYKKVLDDNFINKCNDILTEEDIKQISNDVGINFSFDKIKKKELVKALLFNDKYN